MTGVTVICWAFLLILIAGRIVNYDKVNKEANMARFLDYSMIFVIIMLLCMIYSSPMR